MTETRNTSASPSERRLSPEDVALMVEHYRLKFPQPIPEFAAEINDVHVVECSECDHSTTLPYYEDTRQIYRCTSCGSTQWVEGYAADVEVGDDAELDEVVS